LRMAASGEPLARETALEARLKGLGFEANSEPLEPGRRSWGGEAAKHSSRLSDESTPAPNLKAGSGLLFSCCLKDTVLVEKFFVRERDGLRRIDFLRLRWVSDCVAEVWREY
jgi:hypothetical protein